MIYDTAKNEDAKIQGGCTLCPRNCAADRAHGEAGFCGVTDRVKAARAGLHFWEEPCISGEAGSGTVFFSGCSLHCVYCQNRDIANGLAGKEITVERLAEIFIEQQERGAVNINLVTPGHYVPQISKAVRLARKNGLALPIVYNTGSYERPEVIRSLAGIVDVWLPDLKYMDGTIAERYSGAPDYFRWASSAIAEMVRIAGEPEFDEAGLMRRGVIVRHLVLPGAAEDSKRIIRYLYETYGDRIYISIMNQYTPVMKGADADKYPELMRTLTEKEYDEVVDYAIDLGVENGFIQEEETAAESFIPQFDGEGI